MNLFVTVAQTNQICPTRGASLRLAQPSRLLADFHALSRGFSPAHFSPAHSPCAGKLEICPTQVHP